MNVARTVVTSLLSLVFLGIASVSSYAADTAKTEHVAARLVTDARSVEPGSTITIGLHKIIKPGWHTYWRNSGDAGTPTSIAWTLPQGASADEILWPAPKRFMVGPVANYGYENEVTLLTQIKVPETLRAGDPFAIKAVVDWLVCEEICIPEQVTLDLSLPVVAKGFSTGISVREIEAARSRLPLENTWPFTATVKNDRIELVAASADISGAQIKGAHFFASDWGAITHAADQTYRAEDGTLAVTLEPYERKIPQTLRGVLVVDQTNGSKTIQTAYVVEAPLTGTLTPSGPAVPTISLATALLFALLGGIILNLMPCVFPVLSIKVLSLLNHSRMGYRQRHIHGLAYTAGVLACFLVFAAIVLAFKAGGAELGWGFQFQSPLFVLLLAYLMFAVGLSQSGLLTFGASLSRLGAYGGNDGYGMSFLAGGLAAVVATPCTAPFMGAALGFAVSQPAPVLLAIFLALGLGLALPYLLLCYWPALLRFLPRPGPWMERLKQALAFPMYATAIWLVWVLAQQAGADAVAAALGGMLLIAFGIWLFTTSGKKWRAINFSLAAAALVAAFAIGLYFTKDAAAPNQTAVAANARYESFTPTRLEELRAQNRPVFVNLTAAWCITCLVNERVALERANVISAFEAANVAYLKGDWTHRDPAITAMLAKFGRNGVPLYVFYPADSTAQPVVLPQILTPEIVLREIGQSKTARIEK